MESVRYRGPPLGSFIDDDGQEESQLIRGVPLALYGELPLAAEIPFKPGLGMRGDDGNEKRAVTDLIADLAIPSVPAAQLALIEPYFDSSGPQHATDACRRLRVLRGIADEHCPRRFSHDGTTPDRSREVFSPPPWAAA
jgi:hypothetical protein